MTTKAALGCRNCEKLPSGGCEALSSTAFHTCCTGLVSDHMGVIWRRSLSFTIGWEAVQVLKQIVRPLNVLPRLVFEELGIAFESGTH